MNVFNQSLQDALVRLRAWIPGLKNWATFQSMGGPDAGAVTAEPPERYTRTVFQSLAVFRFFSFAMGTGLIFAMSSDTQPEVDLGVAAGIAGLYNIVRVVWHSDPARPRPLLDGVALAVDLSIAIGLVILTGALDSPFLIYSLAPTLAAGLLMNASASVVCGGIAALSVSGAHIAPGLGFGNFPGILEGNYLAFALIYSVVSMIVALLPFLTNLNMQRRAHTLALLQERQRLRREVHDNVAQTLAFLSMKMKRMEERALQSGAIFTAPDVDDFARAIERSHLAVRDYIDGAGDGGRPETLESTLAAAAKTWSQDTGLPVNIRMAKGSFKLPPYVTYQLLQICREALANVAKHASPAHVWVDLEHSPTMVTLRVRDDGRGFSTSQPRGHGLDIMNERAAIIGASVTVSSTPAQGAEIVVVYPYTKKGVAT